MDSTTQVVYNLTHKYISYIPTFVTVDNDNYKLSIIATPYYHQ